MAGGYGGAPNAFQGALSGAATGASIGSVIPGLGTAAGAAIGAGISLVPSLFRAIAGGKQRRDARNMHPVDPNYQQNQGILDNKQILQNQYNNYQMPGYNTAKNNIGSAYGSAFNSGIQGASSSGDVLDLATRLAYGQSQALTGLETQNAQGKQEALNQYLGANAAAGQEGVNANAYARDKYQGQLREKAALLQAGNENIYGAIDQGATVAGAYLNPRKTLTDQSGLNPSQYAAMQKYMQTYGIQ